MNVVAKLGGCGLRVDDGGLTGCGPAHAPGTLRAQLGGDAAHERGSLDESFPQRWGSGTSRR